jgi:hypothetical protein
MSGMPFFLLQLESKPFVRLTQAYLPLPWNKGLFLNIRLRASHVILTSNAITYFREDKLNDLRAAGWQSFSCRHNDDSLCLHSAELDFFNANFVQEPYVYSDSLTRQYAVGKDICQRNSARQPMNSSRYTVSMCDLVDTRGQFVLLEKTQERMLFFKADSTSLLQYAMLAIVCLYAVATLANHAVLLIKTRKTQDTAQEGGDAKNPLVLFIPTRVRKYMQVSVLHVGLGLYLATAVLLDMPNIATRSEAWLALYLVAYILWDCVFCVAKLCYNFREELKQINVMVVILILCCLRLFHTFQNVFHLLLTVLFSIRTWCKVVLVALINARASQEPMKLLECNISLMYDVVTLYVVLACMNHTTESVFHSQMLHITVLLVGVTAGALIAMLHKCR